MKRNLNDLFETAVNEDTQTNENLTELPLSKKEKKQKEKEEKEKRKLDTFSEFDPQPNYIVGENQIIPVPPPTNHGAPTVNIISNVVWLDQKTLTYEGVTNFQKFVQSIAEINIEKRNSFIQPVNIDAIDFIFEGICGEGEWLEWSHEKIIKRRTIFNLSNWRKSFALSNFLLTLKEVE